VSARLICALLLVGAPIALVTCSRDDAKPAVDTCAIFFGTPNDQTGLSADQCRPECACGDTRFIPPHYDSAFIQALIEDWQIATPYAPLVSDPYSAPPPVEDAPSTVCAVLAKGSADERPRPYDLVTYSSEEAARAAGAAVTHFGHCGVCSTLANLAVYMRENDLTSPVRACGLSSSGDGAAEADVACLEKLGFDHPCAQAWAYNTQHTKSVCLAICIANLQKPYNLDDGAINPCLQCDEDQSGPVFKAVAGRTRRNSGLPNAICRPCSEVRPLVHAY
jgi:hypothetical protein